MGIFTISVTFILSQQKKKFKSHKKVSENKDFCNVIIAFEDSKIFKINLIKHHLLFTQILNA